MKRHTLYVGNTEVTHRFMGDELIYGEFLETNHYNSGTLYDLEGENRLKLKAHPSTIASWYDTSLLYNKVYLIKFTDYGNRINGEINEINREMIGFTNVERIGPNEDSYDYYIIFKNEEDKKKVIENMFKPGKKSAYFYHVTFYGISNKTPR
ncbi:hypothetical protein O3794_02875 [Gemella sanguinis]|uniref:hypothetical protein n=1 Tax=Gemella sanguinis TaxID=84135 RepID=UPI00352D70D4